MTTDLIVNKNIIDRLKYFKYPYFSSKSLTEPFENAYLHDVVEWLIEQYGIYVQVYYDEIFSVSIIDMFGQYNPDGYYNRNLAHEDKCFNEYQKALDYGIEEALKLI